MLYLLWKNGNKTGTDKFFYVRNGHFVIFSCVYLKNIVLEPGKD